MAEEKPGIIYILTNPSFPNYVKIGKTTRDLQQRLNELSNPTCLPFSFRGYAVYKVDKNLDAVEKAIHNLIDKIDYDLRAREEVDSGRLREREFFALDADNAFEVLREVAVLRNDEHNLTKVKQTKNEKKEEEIAQKVEVQAQKLRNENFSFDKKGISPGTLIEFSKDSKLLAKVIDDKYIEYQGQSYTLSGLARKFLDKTDQTGGVNGTRFFKLNGKILGDLPNIIKSK